MLALKVPIRIDDIGSEDVQRYQRVRTNFASLKVALKKRISNTVIASSSESMRNTAKTIHFLLTSSRSLSQSDYTDDHR